MKPRTLFEGVTPILPVRQLDASIDFYVKVLGFTVNFIGPGEFASVSRDRCCVFLCEGDQGNLGTWVWIGVDDVEVFLEEDPSEGLRGSASPNQLSVGVRDADRRSRRERPSDRFRATDRSAGRQQLARYAWRSMGAVAGRQVDAGRSMMRATALIAASLTISIAGAQQAADVPAFAVDRTWPQPLPNNWAVGPVSGIATDARDHIWIIHRGETVKQAGGVPAPPVIEFDAAGQHRPDLGWPG